MKPQQLSCCFVSQRYWKMKAIHNNAKIERSRVAVVLYPKDTEKWKQFTTNSKIINLKKQLFCIPKILKNESNSQLTATMHYSFVGCFVSQRYWKMKAIHNSQHNEKRRCKVVLYPKDTEKWKQFTTCQSSWSIKQKLFCIPKILKNESNSQRGGGFGVSVISCFVSQRYWKMKAIHNFI